MVKFPCVLAWQRVSHAPGDICHRKDWTFMKIGFAAATHPDYVDGTVNGIIDRAAENLAGTGVEIFRPAASVFNTDEQAMAAGNE
jgi:hypothetical protein